VNDLVLVEFLTYFWWNEQNFLPLFINCTRSAFQPFSQAYSSNDFHSKKFKENWAKNNCSKLLIIVWTHVTVKVQFFQLVLYFRRSSATKLLLKYV